MYLYTSSYVEYATFVHLFSSPFMTLLWLVTVRYLVPACTAGQPFSLFVRFCFLFCETLSCAALTRTRPTTQLVKMKFGLNSLLLLLLVSQNDAFTTNFGRNKAFAVAPSSVKESWNVGDASASPVPQSRLSLLVLNAKKKKGNKAADAALAALDALEDQIDAAQEEPLSLKEQKMLEKKAKKAAKQQQNNNNNGQKQDPKAAALAALDALDDDLDAPLSKKELKAKQKAEKKAEKQAEKQEEAAAPPKKMNAKEAALQKLLEMEAADAARASAEPEPDTPKLSKKEQKKADKLAAKKAAKAAKRAAKKAGIDLDAEEVNGVNGVPELTANGDAPAGDAQAAPKPKKDKMTLEDKIRKERPPPRIRIMESAQPGYVALRLENVGIFFREQEVLKDVTWGVQTGDRIGLVGENGAGKTTQLRILAGELEPTTGDVVKSSNDLRVAMLRQEFVDELVLERTLMEEFMSVFTEENKILQDLRDAEKELEALGEGGDPDKMQEILDNMQKLQGKADAKGVYALASRARKVMDLMGFTEDESNDPVRSFSGGWKMRIGLGKVLLLEPNVLLLDEPTNHLDLESVEWLEEFLRQQQLPMIIVSHDREFLDQVCTKTVDAEGGICTEYDGNYSRFLELKKARMDAWHAAYNAQEKKIKEERQWINKFKVKQPQAVKQRTAKLEKLMKSDDYVKKPPFTGKPFRFRFPDAPRLSPEVAEFKGLYHSYGNDETLNRLFEDVNLFVEKGDRIAVLGPNGSGKSTLLRILMGKEDPDKGEAGLVGQNVIANYFEQNQADTLDLDKTVIETIQGASNGQSYNELRALLGQFLFKGDAVEKKIKFLSGGEKARVSLACMMLRPANLLILDEPTNHLDIPAKEMLEEALQHFAGSVMVISHDRYFISKAATTIVAIEEKQAVKYQGDYKFYMEKSKHVKEKVEARYVKGVDRIGSAPIVDLEELNKPKRNFGGAKTANQVSRKDKGIKNAKRNGMK